MPVWTGWGTLAAATLLLLAPSITRAAQYPGWGDTGWVYASKRDCCDEAIGRAQEDSAAVCHNAGGIPKAMRGGVQRRGSCAWESRTDANGDVVFRCLAEATVLCR
jgi:hypothetical protein